ncbi:hypothetical protein EV127DRAFT_439740 [Xylaria flabelliformis]|nr:hypothetical protein EV127DRAFT_439740 [Xylaria flabelliformis]
MASTDILMSSPHRPRALNQTSVPSSSPCLPSLDEIFLKNRPDRPSGTHAATIPANARTTFTSAANILREAPEIDIDTEVVTSSPPRRVKTPTKNRRRKASIPNNSSNDQSLAQPAVMVGSLSPQDKPWQKFKSKSPIQQSDQNLPPARLKARASNAISKTRPAGTGESVSRHFTPTAEDLLSANNARGEKRKIDKNEPADGALANVQSETAMPRRGDWTPPKANESIVLDFDSDSRELFSSAEKAPVSKDVFQTLYNQYGRQDLDISPEGCPQPQAGFLKKRKRIEMISTGQEEAKKQTHEEIPCNDLPQPNEQKQRKAPKEPAPRKKTRTITELAIAPFAAPVSPNFDLAGPATKDSMLDYFDADGAVKALVEHQSAVMSQRKPKAKETKQPPKTKRKKKAGTQANPILLSPSSALKQSSNQDFVFGTSSQLMQEDSPTTLRDLQAAIRASNTLHSDPFDEDVGRRLWQAGSRDEGGELMEMDIIDLQHSSTIIMEPDSAATPGDRRFVDINDLLDSPRPVSPILEEPSESEQANSHSLQSQSTKHDSIAKSSESEGSANTTTTTPRPNYELFTDAQLSKQIISYGFKPVKKRTAMIALLNQCWTSKHSGTSAGSIQPLSTSTRSPPLVQQKPVDATSKAPAKPRGRGRSKKTDDTSASVAQPTPSDKPSPKRSRGRPPKDKTTSTPITEPGVSASNPKRPRGRPRKSSNTSIEIPDSENETPSPMSSPDPVFSSPPPLDLTISDEGDMSLTLSPTDQETELFKHITTAVTSAPRSQDPSKPSWHEKMLLYDPIILEELTSWLNGGELTRVGYDGEVSPFDVKKWCESKSVICLWMRNLRGKERKRY